MQRSKKIKNFYFTIVSSVKKYGRVPIPSKLGISKQRLYYYTKQLVLHDIIKKIGYGVWQIKKESNLYKLYITEKRSKKSKQIKPHVDTPSPSNRGHAFVFTLQIPKIPNWHKRTKFLEKNNIPYKDLKIFGKGQRIYYQNKKIWLTDKSIVIYDKRDYIAYTAGQSKSFAIVNMFEIVEKLGNLMGISFKIDNRYIFKTSRQHHAKMNDALAKQYRKDGKKLQVRNHKGVWLIADYSHSIDELETIHPKTAVEDMENVISFFNHIKDKPEWATIMEKQITLLVQAVTQPPHEEQPPEKLDKKLTNYFG